MSWWLRKIAEMLRCPDCGHDEADPECECTDDLCACNPDNIEDAKNRED